MARAIDPTVGDGLLVVDKREPGGYVTPVECVGEYATYVSRVREDPTVENGLTLWCVSDNLRKGAALNALQLAEMLIGVGPYAVREDDGAATTR